VPADDTDTFSVPCDTEVTLTADNSDPSCVFLNWTGDEAGVANPLIFTMDTDKDITGNCTEAATYTLTMQVVGDGTTVPAVGDHVYIEDTVVPITANPGAGSEFIGWTGDVADPNNPNTTVTMDADKTVTANFAEDGVLTGIDLGMGWRTFSTPVTLDPNYNTWGDLAALGGFDWVIAYYYDCEDEEWKQLVDGDDDIWPCDAIYVLMAEAGTVPIIPDPWATPPCIKELCAGWNLVGLSSLVDMTVEQALATVYVVGCSEVDSCPVGDLTGYAQVLSPDINDPDHWVYVRDWPTNPLMVVGKGYWVFMINPGTLGGFTSTPVLL
jgi:uncharacterized repeat protein (TIGR02543 family)